MVTIENHFTPVLLALATFDPGLSIPTQPYCLKLFNVFTEYPTLELSKSNAG